MAFRIRHGQVTGRNHLFSRRNCQDAFGVGETDSSRFAVVADGCGEGTKSEVGANLACFFTISKIGDYLADGLRPRAIVKELYVDLLISLKKHLLAQGVGNGISEAEFIKNYFLFTLVGFISTEENTVIFSAGDGTVVINNDILLIDQGNQPLYIAYHLIDRKYLSGSAESLPTSFETLSFETSGLQRLAVGTDAWEEEQYLLFSEVWGHKHPLGLQRRMNVWSEKEKKFKDDATLITLEKETE